MSQLPRVHDHSRPLAPPRPDAATPSPAAPRVATSFRSASRSPVPASVRTTPPEASRLLTTPVPAVQPVPEVSLTAPRPDGARVTNEYVETPFRPGSGHAPTTTTKATPKHQQRGCPKERRRRQHQHNHQVGEPRPLTKQPVSFTKEPATRAEVSPSSGNGLSIMCERCGRCRCESCREPPSLPSRWLCGNACLCSAETALDYASCLCCVKGLFYHCADGGLGPSTTALDDDASEAGAGCADEPCSCTGPRVAARWGCLGALAVALPCLLCYWPLRGCVALCEAGYRKHAAQGCRCEPRPPTLDPEKRLLDPAPPDL